MRLLLLGNPRLGRSWKNDVAHAARSLGWGTTVLQDDAVTVDEVVGRAGDADLLLWARSHGHAPAGDLTGLWRRVEASGCAGAAVHLDLYWGIPRREREIGVHPWWRAPWVFTADGGHQQQFAGRGVNHVWMPPPCPDRFVGRTMPDPSLACDVLFVGGCSRTVHHGRREMLDWAARRYGQRFKWVGGRNTDRVWGRNLNALYASAAVILGDSVPSPYYWSDRVPCTAGRGGVLIHPHVEGLAEQYGSALAYWRRGSLRELGATVDSLLEDPARRETMRRAAVTVVREKHLWRHRLADIATTCGVL